MADTRSPGGRHKSKQALRDYQKVLVQLESLEIGVGDQCRKEFTGGAGGWGGAGWGQGVRTAAPELRPRWLPACRPDDRDD